MATPDRAAQVDAFIQEELESFAISWVRKSKAAILRRKIRSSGSLLNSQAADVVQRGVNIYFDPSGRFHDMGAGSGYNKGVYIGKNKDVSLLKGGHKPSQWYSPLAFGSVYGTLSNNLARKFIEKVAEIIDSGSDHER